MTWCQDDTGDVSDVSTSIITVHTSYSYQVSTIIVKNLWI